MAKAAVQCWLLPDAGCYVCGQLHGLERHHMNGDHEDESSRNVVRLCRDCHVYVGRAPGLVDWNILRAWAAEVRRIRRLDEGPG